MLRRMAPWIFASLLACFPLSLQAVPFFVSGDSGLPGESVEVGLSEENTDKFLAATIEVLFDGNVLSFAGASLGDLISDTNLGFGPLVIDQNINVGIGSAVISLIGLTEVTGSGRSELLRISFRILASALAGDTVVSFACQNPTATGDNSCTSDYNIPLTTGTVTVLASSTPIPLPSSAWLLALGLAIIPAVRMRS